jgi:hypothetical protein
MMRTLVFLCFPLLLLGSAHGQELGAVDMKQQLLACETCGCSPVTGPVQNFYEPGWVMQFNGQYSSLTTGMDGSQILANPEGQSLNSSIAQLSAAYNFSQDWGVQLVVPYLNRNYRRTAGDHMESGTLAGLGDITLSGRYSPVAHFDEDSNFVWNLQLGLKLPTGSSGALREELQHLSETTGPNESPGPTQDGDLPTPVLAEPLVGGHDLALGSGSLDGVLGTSLFYRQQSLFLNAGAQYLLRTRGSYGYQFGNALLWNFSPGFLLSRDPEQLVGLQLNLSGEIKQQDNIQGLPIDHTGMTGIYAGPQLFISGTDLNMQAAVDFPLVQHTDGPTLVQDYRLKLQLNWKL